MAAMAWPGERPRRERENAPRWHGKGREGLAPGEEEKRAGGGEERA